MKIKSKITILLIGITFMFTGYNCQKVGDTAPGLSIYKTKGDYFNYVSVSKEGDRIIFRPGYYNPRYNTVDTRLKISDTDTIYTRRAKLIDGYVISAEIGEESVFVDFTFAEYLKFEIENDGGIPSDSLLLASILDEDPFIELYYDSNRPRKYEISDTALINQMIIDGELEKYFERIKLTVK